MIDAMNQDMGWNEILYFKKDCSLKIHTDFDVFLLIKANFKI